MRKNLSKKVICSLLVGCLSVTMLAGCSSNKTSNSNSEGVATINGEVITRETVGDSLITAEQEAISEYLYSVMLEKFFKGVEVTDEELNVQMELMKSQVGEESWPMYLTYYGGGSEEVFKDSLKKSLKQEKYISEKSKTIEIAESELQNTYNENPDKYNIAVLDSIFLPDEAALTKATELSKDGKTLEEISKTLNIDISKNEHTYFASENLNWSKSFNDCSIGDIVTTDGSSGSFVIASVVALNKGIDNKVVYDDLVAGLKYSKAYEITQSEYTELLKATNVEIMGQPYNLYEEEHNEGEQIEP